MSSKPEDILDACLEARRTGGDPEAVLHQHPDEADEVRPLVELAARLEALPSPRATAPGLLTAFARAMAEQPKAERAERAVRSGARRWLRRLAIAAAVVLVVFAGWGTVSVSADSVPGDWLYPVKLLTERVRYALAVNPEGKAELLITFSDERLSEAVRKHQQGRGLDRDLLARMLRHAEQAIEMGPAVPEHERGVLIQRVTWTCQAQQKALAKLRKAASAEERELLDGLVTMCSERCECLCQMTGRCEDCVPKDLTAEAMRQWAKRFAGYSLKHESGMMEDDGKRHD